VLNARTEIGKPLGNGKLGSANSKDERILLIASLLNSIGLMKDGLLTSRKGVYRRAALWEMGIGMKNLKAIERFLRIRPLSSPNLPILGWMRKKYHSFVLYKDNFWIVFESLLFMG
jgi:hypothetical protein